MKFNDNLNELNKRGLIHAPDESDDTFFLRCHRASINETSPSSSLAKTLFDIDPDWVLMIYENKGLRFWEGGCTWAKKDSVMLQLNRIYKKKSHFMGYSRDEVIAHELVHVVRGQFEEPIFEEILAYQTSSSPFRRFFAPLFRSSNESLLFVITLSAIFLTTLLDMFQKIAFFSLAGLIAAGSFRLLWAQHKFSRSKKKLSQIVGKERVLAVMLRLTDREIIRFAKMNREEIINYAQKMAKIQMRWQQIVGAYFS